MKKSNIVNIHEYKIHKNYFTIGLLVGALRAELENGTVEMESVYSILTDNVKQAISSDLVQTGGAAK